jgi:tetratricopeptide (TPR) repeat protein
MVLFEAAGDELGMAKAWTALAIRDHMLARFEPYREAMERALGHLRRAGGGNAVPRTLGQIAHAVAVGPTPVPDALARLDEILAERPDDRELRARVQTRRGFLLALAADEAGATAALAEAESILSELGNEFFFGSFGLIAGNAERFLGRLDRSEQALRRADDVYERAGERSVRSTVLAALARALAEQERDDEAERTARLALELGSSDDFGTVAFAEAALANLAARRGDATAAERSLSATALGEETDMLWMQGELWQSHAEVLALLGYIKEARDAERESADRFARKGAVGQARKTRVS